MDRPRPKFESEFDDLRARIEQLEARVNEDVDAVVGGTQEVLFPLDQLSNDASPAALRGDTRLEDLFSQVEDLFGVVKLHGDQPFYLSPGITSLTGLEPKQIYAAPLAAFELVHEDDRKKLLEFFAPEARERELEFRFCRPDGDVIWLWLRSWDMCDASGLIEQIVFTGRDITARKAEEDALREREERYHALSKLNSDLSFTVTFRDRRVVEISAGARAFEDITGYPFEPSYAKAGRWPKWVPNSETERLFKWADETVSGTNDQPIEHCIMTRDGEVRWLKTSMKVHERSGADVKVLVSTRDVTERHLESEAQRRYAVRLEVEVAERTRELESMNQTLRALQNRLMRAERLRTAEDLAASIAHSINNPLAALMGHLQMMAERDGSDPLLGRTRELAHRIKVVVDRTLALFRKGTLDLGDHLAAEITEEVERELEVRAKTNGVKLHASSARELPVLVVDRALIVAALVSVAENAIDAMPDGGDLWIDAGFVPGIDVCRFRIADTGNGIPEELRSKVLEPFFTTKGGGTGLGLAIAQGVVQGHDGRIEIGRRNGGGTLVTIEVPIRPGALGSQSKTATQAL